MSFHVAEDKIAQKYADDSDIGEEDLSVDTASRSFPSGLRDAVWWFCVMCWQALAGNCSTLLKCMQYLRGPSPHNLFTLAEYCPTHFKSKLSKESSILSNGTVEKDTAESRNLLKMMKITRLMTDFLSGKLDPESFIVALTAAVVPKGVNESNFLERFKKNFWNMSHLVSSAKNVFEAIAIWIIVGCREMHFVSANLSLLRDTFCTARTLNALDMTNMLRMVSIVGVLTTGAEYDRLDILHSLSDIVIDILYLPPGREVDTADTLIEMSVEQCGCGYGRSYQGCALLEHVACIEYMNMIYRLYSPRPAFWSRFLNQLLSAIPGPDVLIEHYLYLCELEGCGTIPEDAGGCFTRAMSKAYPTHSDLLETITVCETQLSQGKIARTNFAAMDTMEALLIGELNQSYYYGTDWCGYFLLNITDSAVLLQLGTYCFIAERYLCLHAIQHELLSRCNEGAMAVTCNFYLSALTTGAYPKFRLESATRVCWYPLSEPFINTDDCKELVVKEMESVAPLSTWSDTKPTAKLVCNMEGRLLEWVPMAVGMAASLTDLNLSNCSIASFPQHVMNLHCLRRLKISHNKLSSLPTDIFSESFVKLALLDLSFNNFAAFPSELSKLSVLQELYLNDNSIEYIPEKLLLMKALRVLDLSNNKLKTLPPGIMALRKQIQFVKLSGNPMISGSVLAGRSSHTETMKSSQLWQNSASGGEKRVLEVVPDETPSKFKKVDKDSVLDDVLVASQATVDFVDHIDSAASGRIATNITGATDVWNSSGSGDVEVIVISGDDLSGSAVSCVNYSEESDLE